VTGRMTYRINAALERVLPEQRLFLRSDVETRFIRLRPLTQLIALSVSAILISWTIVATAILLVSSISSGDARQQVLREQANYEARLNDLSNERDQRAAEAASAQDRFNVALAQVSAMQSQLLASEDHRKELETGIDVIQRTLRRTIKERDDARAETGQLKVALAKQTGADHTDAGRIKDVAATIDTLTSTLSDTARERDAMADDAKKAQADADNAALDLRLSEQRNDKIFAKLEAAVTVSMAPLDKMFRSVGLDPQKVISEIHSGYSGQGGPLSKISFPVPPGQSRANLDKANAVLASLNQMNLYRLAASKVPLGLPLKTHFVYTSPFGYRTDPFNGSRSFHPGQDMGGAYGSPIYATAGGVVIYASWMNGYGRMVQIQHAFGISTVFGHMSQIRVKVGQRVSRGDRIGDMGSSGRSTGTHLHYEVRIGNKPVNPMTYIKAATNVF
jgi:murein DD-endopeptidase MepM/ murein hydrolase activator NlpD